MYKALQDSGWHREGSQKVWAEKNKRKTNPAWQGREALSHLARCSGTVDEYSAGPIWKVLSSSR